MAGVAAISAFAMAAPVASAALPDVTSAASGTASSAGSAVGAVAQQATTTVATTQQVAAQAEHTVSKAQPPAPRPQAPRPPAPAPRALPQAPKLPERPAVALPSVETPPAPVEIPPTQDVVREVGRQRDTIARTVDRLPALGRVDDAVTLLGDTLRRIAPVGSLLAPIAPLLGSGGPLHELPDLVAVVSPTEATSPLDVRQGRPPAGDVLSAAAGPRGAAAGELPAPAHTFQAASARPPAAEVGGRPVSSSPWTAPAPAAGGATAVFSGAAFFVPFLGLLVLAALAAPRLMRRLDELPAFVRPGPFLCALERPG